MFAVVEIAGKQYLVAPGEHIVVDKTEGAVGDTVTFPHVLLLSKEEKTSIGTPYIKGKKVTAKILKQFKGEKLSVRRFKSKVRYRRHIGFRAFETELSIESIA